jgi:hypothetical protein
MVDWRGGPPTGKARRVRPPRAMRLPEPPVTIAEMRATYCAIAPRCAPLFAAVLRDIMVRCVEGNRELLFERQPGEDG